MANVALPAGSGRIVYIRVVCIVLQVISNAVQLIEGTDALGKSVFILKQPSKRSTLDGTNKQQFDIGFIKALARRVVDDHKTTSPYLRELGLQLPLVRRLYLTLTLTLTPTPMLTLMLTLTLTPTLT